MKKIFILLILILGLNLGYSIEFLPNFDYYYQMELAKDMHRHGFLETALELLIRIHNFRRTPEDLKAESLYLMGEISYERGDFKTAIDDWEILYNLYPDNELTDKILERLAVIRTDMKRREKLKVSAIDMANDYYRHNFADFAKEKFLEIYHDPDASENDKAEALFLVGQITFEEGNYTLALDDWEILIEKFPESKHTLEIASRLSQLKDIITQDSDGNVINVLAKAYLKNGDFWSSADRKFIIDSSWMPSVEIAIEWYDRMIKEFPNTTSAEVAYQRKLFTLLGSSDPDNGDTKFGIQADFDKYIPQVLNTFNSLEKEFPNSSYLQGFRYQIAQAYWSREDWLNTRKWLRKVIDAGNGEETFYTKTAKARLKKIEY